MATTALLPDARSWAEQAALRVGQILTGLSALIAARHRRLPSVALANRLNSFVNRTRQRLLALLVRFAAGRLRPTPPRPTPPRPGRPRAPEPRRLRLPRRHGWLIIALPNEAAAYAGQLEALLAEPGMADLIARHPTAASILAPLRRLLTVAESPPKRPPRAAPPHPASRREPPPRPVISLAARRALAFKPL